jgi:DNA-binding transcriptional LysR family regulator
VKLATFYDKVSRMGGDVRGEKADIFVSLRCELPKQGYVRRTLLERHVIALTPLEHRLAQRDRISITDLRDEPLVFWKRDSVPGFYDALVEQCGQAGFQPRFAELYDLEDAIVMSVSSGNGITILFDKTSVPTGEGIAHVPIDDVHIPVDVAYAYAEDRMDAGIAAVSQAFEALREEHA